MMRRAAVLDAIKDWIPGTVLEFGFGTGIFAYEFYLRGFECSGYEVESKSFDIANELFNKPTKIIDFTNEMPEISGGGLRLFSCIRSFGTHRR